MRIDPEIIDFIILFCYNIFFSLFPGDKRRVQERDLWRKKFKIEFCKWKLSKVMKADISFNFKIHSVNHQAARANYEQKLDPNLKLRISNYNCFWVTGGLLKYKLYTYIYVYIHYFILYYQFKVSCLIIRLCFFFFTSLLSSCFLSFLYILFQQSTFFLFNLNLKM